jgi:hypothetical protein
MINYDLEEDEIEERKRNWTRIKMINYDLEEDEI